MRILCVIPSRIGSTRLPRKPLSLIKNKPMIQWVYENAANCCAIDKVIVATDSQEIAQVIRAVGGCVQITPSEIATGSDRVAYVAKNHPDYDVIINLQGDEPFIAPIMLTQLISPYLEGDLPLMTTLACPFERNADYSLPDKVKVILDNNKNAIYFSRSPIPYFREQVDLPIYHHMGIYAFTREFLMTYTELPKLLLERCENLEQLRAIEHGYKIRVCLTSHRTLEINTPAELEQAQLFEAM